SISSAYSDISATGTQLFQITTNATTTDLRLRRKLVFPSGFTFPFEGEDRTEAFVGSTGYLTFDPTATESNSDPNYDNPSSFPRSSGTGLNAVIAPFWD